MNDEGLQPLPPDIAAKMDMDTQLRKFFNAADANKDGKVTKEELLDFFMRCIDHEAGIKELNVDSDEEREYVFLIEHFGEFTKKQWHTRHVIPLYHEYAANT